MPVPLSSPLHPPVAVEPSPWGLDDLLGAGLDPRVVRLRLPSPGTPPPPTGGIVVAVLQWPAPFEEPWGRSVVPRILPSPLLARLELVAPVVRADDVFEDVPPRVASPRSLASPGTPPVLSVGPPGRPRVAYGIVEEGPPRSSLPCLIPSAGTPTLDRVMPPGFVPVIVADPAPMASRSWVPQSIPSHGNPGGTGPGLMVPAHRIAISWAAGGWLGGGGLLGGVGGELAGTISGDNGLAPWGAAAPWSDGAPFLEGGRASNGPGGFMQALPGVQPVPPWITATGAFSLGGICGCCQCAVTVCTDCIPPGGSATVTVLSDGEPIWTCTVFYNAGLPSCCQVKIPGAGTYEVTVSIDGNVIYDQDVALKCSSQLGVFPYCITICVTMCGIPIPADCPVTGTVKCGGNTVWTGKTDANGCLNITIPPGINVTTCVLYLSDLPPNFTSPSGGYGYTQWGMPIGLDYDANTFVCCSGLLMPRVFTLTDGAGSCTMTWGGSGITGFAWTGCHAVEASPVIIWTMDNACTLSDGSADISIMYTGFCGSDPMTGAPNFTINRTWYARPINITEGPCYYMQNLGGTPCNGAGCDCFYALGGVGLCGCASSQGDFNEGTALLPPICDGFESLTVPMSDFPPICGAAGSNCLPDPVGGNVTIS